MAADDDGVVIRMVGAMGVNRFGSHHDNAVPVVMVGTIGVDRCRLDNGDAVVVPPRPIVNGTRGNGVDGSQAQEKGGPQ